MEAFDKMRNFIAPSADVVGDVVMGACSSIWYQAVLRGDGDPIRIGRCSNIQDGCILHTDKGYPIVIGDYVTIGHGAIIHGCTIGDNTLIGMGAIILNGAEIGKNCLIGAGALVTQGVKIPDGMMVLGSPAKVRRVLTSEEIEKNREAAEEYLNLSSKMRSKEEESDE